MFHYICDDYLLRHAQLSYIYTYIYIINMKTTYILIHIFHRLCSKYPMKAKSFGASLLDGYTLICLPKCRRSRQVSA